MNSQNQTISSLEVAEMLEMEHWQLLRKLEGTDKFRGIIQILTDNKIVVSDYFIQGSYKDASGKENKCYQFTKLGCDFIANKFNGENGVLFTAKYVKKFNDMQSTLSEYKPKMTSLGEVANYIKLVSKFMEKQGSTVEQIVQMIDNVNKQFGIELPTLAKHNPWEQMTLTVTTTQMTLN